MKNILKSFLLIFALATTWAHAEDIAPDVLAKTTTEEVLSIVKNDKEIQSGDSKKVLALVETKVLPHFDFAHMTRLAVGKYWRQANAEQQSSLVNEFRTLLVRTYASSLSLYRNQIVEFEPLKSKPEDTDVTVSSAIKQSGKQPLAVDYNMEKTPTGWKVYDVIIGGVSLVTTYRSTFANEINRNGVDGLIKLLADKNKANQQKTLSKQ
jgi:phospholipid transport system substrate-binding protein